jgi:hypothetical protein
MCQKKSRPQNTCQIDEFSGEMHPIIEILLGGRAPVADPFPEGREILAYPLGPFT